MFRTVNKSPSATTHIPQVSCLSSSVPTVSYLSSRAHQDSRAPDAVPLSISLHGQSPLDDLQKITNQTQRRQIGCGPCCEKGRQAPDSSDLSDVEGQSGPCVGATEASEVKSNRWDRRRERRVQDKIENPAESKLQNLNKALANLQKGEDQVNMEVTEHAEPGQAGAGNE